MKVILFKFNLGEFVASLPKRLADNRVIRNLFVVVVSLIRKKTKKRTAFNYPF